jgi:hypothetical protein
VYQEPRTSIAARLQADLHERIKRDASAAGRSISEEIERRLERSFEWEAQFGDIKKMMRDAEETIKRGAEAQLRHWGWREVVGRDGMWIAPDVPMETYVALNPQIESMIERAATRAVELALQKGQKS